MCRNAEVNDQERANRDPPPRMPEHPQRTTVLDDHGEEGHSDSDQVARNNLEERPVEGQSRDLPHLNSEIRGERFGHRRKARAESPPEVRSIWERKRKRKR